MTPAMDKAEAAFTALINSAHTPEERAEVIEFLARRLGRGVVVLCDNNQELIGLMMEGSTAFAFEEAAGFSPTFDMMTMMAAANRKAKE
jgi:hypothetical protein